MGCASRDGQAQLQSCGGAGRPYRCPKSWEEGHQQSHLDSSVVEFCKIVTTNLSELQICLHTLARTRVTSSFTVIICSTTAIRKTICKASWLLVCHEEMQGPLAA
eukprot:5337810-Amphidinium_carterae.1